MPVLRFDKEALSYKPYTMKSPLAAQTASEELETTSKSVISVPAKELYYPQIISEREKFRTKAGKKVTSHQWAVYDLTFSIPLGRVTTYKDVCALIGEGSPRSVGTALRNNPFAPVVPCHRVIASNNFIGGFFGEWGKDSRTGTQYGNKLALLASESVQFTDKGFLKEPENTLWHGSDSK